MADTSARPGLDGAMRNLRQRADDDFTQPHAVREVGRHSVDVEELGLRVSLTRARYPNRADGVDQYAVTITRRALDHAPADPEIAAVLVAAFGSTAADLAVERRAGPLVKMFRVPTAV